MTRVAATGEGAYLQGCAPAVRQFRPFHPRPLAECAADYGWRHVAGASRPWQILAGSGRLVFTLEERDEAFAFEILKNLNDPCCGQGCSRCRRREAAA